MINVAVADAAPVMYAEAASYMLQAEALEQVSIESRMGVLEFMSMISMAPHTWSLTNTTTCASRPPAYRN